MKAITLKSIPDDLVESLKRRAKANQRSLSGEILFRLRKSVDNESTSENLKLREDAIAQADAWKSISGNWVADESIDDEIAALYAERSTGRDVDVSW